MGETPLVFSFLPKPKNRYFAGFLHSKSGGALYGFDEVVSLSDCPSDLVGLWVQLLEVGAAEWSLVPSMGVKGVQQ
jgi:hypothetical protein